MRDGPVAPVQEKWQDVSRAKQVRVLRTVDLRLVWPRGYTGIAMTLPTDGTYSDVTGTY